MQLYKIIEIKRENIERILHMEMQEEKKAGTTKKYSIMGVIILTALTIAIALYHFSSKSYDFNKKFEKYAGENWCQISNDGSYMIIDSNPYDQENVSPIAECIVAIEEINEELGFSSSLFKKMSSTRALDGRQTQSNEKYTVSLIYHPDSGLEILYEVN